MSSRDVNSVEIAPSILAADFARLGEEIQAVKEAGARIIHVDVMDGHFVPNLTIGAPVVASLRKATDLLLDCHLMIEEPDRQLEAFVEAGADMISVHQEACRHLDRTLNAIRAAGVEAGAVLNPATPVASLSEVLGLVDYVLIMSVNPGFGGQQFIPHSLNKVRQLVERRADENLHFRIEIDGGMGLDTIGDVVRAGVDIVVAGTSIFHAPSPKEALLQLRQAASLAAVPKP
ncbi:MAG: ribulose-phosphate 3-epimerase [Acidobacteria bacterium]|nr:ribulose-phosphate 3-epimerase [Acidobacteriota bacterium]